MSNGISRASRLSRQWVVWAGAMVAFLAFAPSGAAAFTTLSINARSYLTLHCSSAGGTEPAYYGPPYFLFAGYTSGGASSSCGADAGGWGYKASGPASGPADPPPEAYSFWEIEFNAPGSFDIAGFDVRNTSGSAGSIAVTSTSSGGGSAHSQVVPVPTGITTITLDGYHTGLSQTTLTFSAGNVSGYSFRNFVLQGTPPLAAPAATTEAASSPGVSGATLNGTVTPNGAVTTVTFEYGPLVPYEASTAAVPGTVGPALPATTVSAALTGLACGATYHYRVKAVNSQGTTNGADATFTTDACPPNNAPTAGSLATSGTAAVGQVLAGSYAYADAESDPENTTGTGTTYRFVRSTDTSVATTGDNVDAATGTTGGTSKSYTVLAADVGKYLFYCVTPRAATGLSPGAEACSNATAQVPTPVDGACDNATHGQVLTSAPSSGLCTAGSALLFASGNDAYTWTCSASNGGVAAACSATRHYVVTPWAGTGGSLSPGTAQGVAYLATPVFTVTADSGYRVQSVSGCAGLLAGVTFTTGAITAPCTVTALFIANGAPTANSVTLSGSAVVGQVLTGNYVYADADSDPENTTGTGTTYRFVHSTDTSVATTGDNVDAATGTTGGTSKSYTVLAADVGKYLFYCVTPRAATGLSPGAEACSSASAQVPTPIDGACDNATHGQVLTSAPSSGLCTAGSALLFASGNDAYTWTCSASNGGVAAACSATRHYVVTPWAGTGGSLSPGTAQGVAYLATPVFTVTADSGYRVQSVSGCDGSLAGVTFTTAAITAPCTVTALFIANGAPTASSVTLAGSAIVGQVLTGSYVYADAESDPENTTGTGTSYRFVRSTDALVATAGDNLDVATGTTGGTSKSYTILAADAGKYLFYCVTPRANVAPATGAEACSGVMAPVVKADQSITWGPLPDRRIGDPPFAIGATGGGSGNPVAFSSLTPGTCSVSATTVTILAAGTCTLAANQPGDATYNDAPQVTRSFTILAGNTIPRLVNLSTRMRVLTGNDVLIGGFIIGGSTPKTVVVRARGPSLADHGIADNLANPKLDLYSGPVVIETNDDWEAHSNADSLRASGFQPSSPLESAIFTTLTPGAYTAVVSGTATGVGIVEVFEIDRPETPLLNISTRGRVLTGNDVMIAGFIVEGDAPVTVIVRARGPSLAAFGIANFLANPDLQLFSGATALAMNDNWGDSPEAATIQSSGFAPSDALESAIRITLHPGAYTAIVTGVGGTTGVAIVEVFVP